MEKSEFLPWISVYTPDIRGKDSRSPISAYPILLHDHSNNEEIFISLAEHNAILSDSIKSHESIINEMCKENTRLKSQIQSAKEALRIIEQIDETAGVKRVHARECLKKLEE